ncbi:hypothetical protein ACQ5JZ_27980, partial [Streptomyces sp. ZG43]
DIEVVWERGRWVVERVASEVRNSNTAEEDPRIVRLLAYGHRLPRGAAWWRELTGPVPEAMSREDGRRAFGLMEPSAAYRSWGYRKAGEGRPGGGGAEAA